MFEDEEPKDWEIEDEEPPERLREKWAKDEILGPGTLTCRRCGQSVPRKNLLCLYCGSRVSENAGFLSWLLSFFKK